MIKFKRKWLLKQVVGYILIKISYLNRKKDGILPILFHNPTPELFERILLWLIKKKYHFISLAELARIISQKTENKRLAIITFDDGWKGNLDLIAIVEKYKTPIAIFIPTEAVITGNYWFEYARLKEQNQYSGLDTIDQFKELPCDLLDRKIEILKHEYSLKRSCMNLDELKHISSNPLVTIGSHTVTHPILDKCSRQRQQRELIESKNILSKWLDKEVGFLAFPNGNFNEDTIEIARACSYKLCVTVRPGIIDSHVDPLCIPRNCIDDTGGYYESIAKTLGVWQQLLPLKTV